MVRSPCTTHHPTPQHLSWAAQIRLGKTGKRGKAQVKARLLRTLKSKLKGALQVWNISVCFSRDRGERSSKTMAKCLLRQSPISPPPSGKHCLSTYLRGIAFTIYWLGFCKFIYPARIEKRTNMLLTIQLKQQSIKKLLLYSKPYKHSQTPVLLPPFP